jgi:hypothetical protein
MLHTNILLFCTLCIRLRCVQGKCIHYYYLCFEFNTCLYYASYIQWLTVTACYILQAAYKKVMYKMQYNMLKGIRCVCSMHVLVLV